VSYIRRICVRALYSGDENKQEMNQNSVPIPKLKRKGRNIVWLESKR